MFRGAGGLFAGGELNADDTALAIVEGIEKRTPSEFACQIAVNGDVPSSQTVGNSR